MDWGTGHLTIIVGTGDGAFANNNCPQDRAFVNFFQMTRVCPGVCPGGMLGVGIDSHINRVCNSTLFCPRVQNYSSCFKDSLQNKTKKVIPTSTIIKKTNIIHPRNNFNLK